MLPLVVRNKAGLRVLCLGAHCDDIEIGCGGTLLKWLEERAGKVRIDWVVLSSTPERKQEALRSARRFLKNATSKNIVVERFEDSFFPYHGEEIKRYIHHLSQQISPDVIFTHYRQDLHQDHRLVSELTWNAFRDHWILEYEIPKYDGDLGSPNVYVPLDQSVCRNKSNFIVNAFQSQRSKSWFRREIFQSLQKLRGVECNSHSGYAEAFYGRKIVL
jgi:LmbE family N-acetylglucosaminyl deacetylase